MDAWVGKYFSIFHVARAGKWISNVVIFDKLLPLMCALRVELVSVYVFFFLFFIIKYVRNCRFCFFGLVGLSIYLERD